MDNFKYLRDAGVYFKYSSFEVLRPASKWNNESLLTIKVQSLEQCLVPVQLCVIKTTPLSKKLFKKGRVT